MYGKGIYIYMLVSIYVLCNFSLPSYDTSRIESVPHAVICTADLVKSEASASIHYDRLEEDKRRMQLALIIVRLVNGVVDSNQVCYSLIYIFNST